MNPSFDVSESISEDIRRLRTHLIAINHRHFISILDAGVVIVFPEGEIDDDYWLAIRSAFSGVLHGGYAEYLPGCPNLQIGVIRSGKSRVLDRLINMRQPAVDAPFLGYLAICLCFKAAEYDDSNNNSAVLFSLFQEASEAVGIARTSSCLVNQIFERDFDANRERIERQRARRFAAERNAKKKAVIEADRRSKTLAEINKLARKVWAAEPYIPVGTMAQVIHEYIAGFGIAGDDYLLPSARKIKENFLASGCAPDTSIYKGAPKKKYIDQRFRGQSYPTVCDLLVKMKYSYCGIPLKSS